MFDVVGMGSQEMAYLHELIFTSSSECMKGALWALSDGKTAEGGFETWDVLGNHVSTVLCSSYDLPTLCINDLGGV